MKEDWMLLIEKYNIEGARIKFENICKTLYEILNPKKNVKSVRVSQGDKGIDIFIGDIGVEPIDVIQCKFFPTLGKSQKDQITKSFNRVIKSEDFEIRTWTLCIINELSVEEHIWWSNWKKKKIKEWHLNPDSILLKDGSDLINLLKDNNLYNTVFEKIDSLRIEEIHDVITNKYSLDDIEITLKKSSNPLQQVKNYIGSNPLTHIPRKQTYEIYTWIKDDLKNDSKNILILTGEKGVGKSVIMKDLYDILTNEGNFVLGIKADKYYYSNITELEKNIFLNSLTFEILLNSFKNKNEKLILLIDQIDALSYSITSNREFINTYTRIISEFENEKNLRVVISTRKYDLEYDAELSIYNSQKYSKKEVALIDPKEVLSILEKYNIQTVPNKFLELLRTPNNLNIFCSLPSKTKINYDTVSSLKDLYDEFWSQLISRNKNRKIKDLIFRIVNKMYEDGIAVGNIYNDDYFDELNYLKSNSVIIENNKRIQFFHQTFYEYCYAKFFVENNNSLEEYIIKNEQSLYIRSVVKMVAEYLREYNINKYVSVLENVLFNQKFRYHIKTVLISCLSIQNNISREEKIFCLNNILNNNEIEELFLTSIYSKDWINFFINENILKGYFEKNKKDLIWTLLARNINLNSIKILKYLENIEFDDKNNYMSRLIINIEDWEDNQLIVFFEKYILYQPPSNNGMLNIWYFKILEKIYKYYPDFVYNCIKEPLIESFSNYNHTIEYSLNELLVEISKTNPIELFNFLLDEVKKIVKETKFPIIYNHHKIKTQFYDSYKNSLFSSEHDEKTIIKHLEELVKRLPENSFNHFFEMNKNVNDVNVIKLIIHGLKSRNSKYSSNVIDLIKIIERKNGFKGRDDEFQLMLRNLITQFFEYFNEEDKGFIINLYLNLTSIYDVYIYERDGKKKYSLNSFGEKKFVFIKSLPESVINNNEVLKKEYQCLYRKFGDIDHRKALNTSIYRSGVVGPPLSQNAYTKMSLTSWKKSILKFNSSYESDEFLRGGMLEHARSFENEVSKAPEKFYNFIDCLFKDKKVDFCYLSYGINGLIKGKYSPDKVIVLYKKLIKLKLDREYLMYSNWKIRYFIETQTIDLEIVEHICNIAKNYPIKEQDLNPNHLLSDGINSVRGSAVDVLLNLYKHKEYKDLVFSTIEEVIENCNLSIKVTIISRIAFLNYLNTSQAFSIFKKLVSTKNTDILKHSINSGQYYNNSFHEEMEDYIVALMENEETQQTNYILVNSYLEGKIYGKKYYKDFIAKGKSAILCALKVAEEFLFYKGRLNNKAITMLYEFLNNDDIEIAREYEAIILRKFKNGEFLELYDFMLAYSKSKVCKRAPHYFLDYLILHSKDYPNECLKLIENIDFSRNPNIQESGYYDKEPIQLVLGIYSKLILPLKKDKEKIEKCLDIFDGMLTHSHLRNNAIRAIELMSE